MWVPLLAAAVTLWWYFIPNRAVAVFPVLVVVVVWNVLLWTHRRKPTP